MRSYFYKGFMIAPGLCELYPASRAHKYAVMDWRDYDEAIGAKPTDICTATIREAKEQINALLYVRQNIPF